MSRKRHRTPLPGAQSMAQAGPLSQPRPWRVSEIPPYPNRERHAKTRSAPQAFHVQATIRRQKDDQIRDKDKNRSMGKRSQLPAPHTTPPAEPGIVSRLFARLGGRGEAVAPNSAVPALREAGALVERVEVPVLRKSPEQDEWREIERGFAALADEGLWISLLDRLRGVDQTRQHFASGRRYADCALAGAITPVTRHLGEPARIDAAAAALAPLTTLHIGNLNDYMPAVILARALIEIGWAVRGPLPPSETPREAIEAAMSYFARAEAVLDSFDPILENSPMLAEARYRLAPGVDGGVGYLRDWYEDWADLDPANPNMLATHAGYLCPDWYGDYDEVEREARRAVRRAADSLGPGAYVRFWQAPLEADRAAVSCIDPELFLQGVHKLLEGGHSQALANEFVALLFRLTLPGASDSAGQAERAEAVRARLAAGLREVALRHLAELQAPVWGIEDDAIRRAIAHVFADDLHRGAVLVAGENGLSLLTGDAGR